MKEQPKSNKRLIGLEFKLDGFSKEDLQTLQIGYGFVDGKFTVRLRTNKGEITTNAIKGFQRKNKPGFNLKKIYHRTNSNSMESTSFLEDLDTVIAIDTNQKQVYGHWMAIGVVAGLRYKLKEDGFADVEAFTLDQLLIQEKIEKPENRNWKVYLEKWAADPTNKGLRTGVIVDSDLGLIDQFNNRTLPIYEDYYLPENIELIYASADIKNDTIINMLVSFCDEVAKKMLNEIAEEVIVEMERIKKALIAQLPEHEEEIKSFYESKSQLGIK